MDNLPNILKEYVNYIFYSTEEKEMFDCFLIDVSKRETGPLFHKGFIDWCKLNYNLNIKYIDAIQLYVNNAKYNSFGNNKFIITDKHMDKVFEIGLLNKIDYNPNDETIVRSEVKRKINKK